ncbi:MAG: hypothetical protein U0163_01740 [Gemmatimonadaceae bacterium]
MMPRNSLSLRQLASPQALATYHGGRVLSNPKVAVIYSVRRTICNNGPAIAHHRRRLGGQFARRILPAQHRHVGVLGINTTYTDNTGMCRTACSTRARGHRHAGGPGRCGWPDVLNRRIEGGIVYAFQTGRGVRSADDLCRAVDTKVNLGGGFGSYCAYHGSSLERARRGRHPVMPFK